MRAGRTSTSSPPMTAARQSNRCRSDRWRTRRESRGRRRRGCPSAYGRPALPPRPSLRLRRRQELCSPANILDNTDLCYLLDLCRMVACRAMPISCSADHMGRFNARRYAFPPMVGRLLGDPAVCDPPIEQSIGELAEALLASRSAIAQAVKALETTHAIRRFREAGERMDRVRIDPSSPRSQGLDISEYEELSELAREGLEVVRDASTERRAVLLEVSAYAEIPAGAHPNHAAGVGGAPRGIGRCRDTPGYD